jgi:hypothetical protein
MQLDSRRSGQRTFLATCALVSTLLLGMTPAVRAQTTSKDVSGETLVTIDVREAGLMGAVQMLSASNGLDNVVVRKPKGRDYNPITMRLTDKPLRTVLNAIATAAGAVLQERDSIFYLIPPEDVVSTAPAVAPTVAVTPTPAAKPRGNHQWTRIKLAYILPSVCKNIIDDPQWRPILEAAPNPISVVPVPSSATRDLVAPANNNGAGGGAGSAAGRDSNSVDSAGARGQGIGAGGRGGFGGGGGFGGQGGGGGFGGQGAGGQGAGGQGAGSLRPQGINTIVSNDADNSLLIDAEDVESVDRLRDLIRLLDIKPKQVLIRVEFVSVNIADADSFGIDWRFSPAGNIDVQIPPANSSAPSITLAYASGNAVANLRASLVRTTQNVFQAPIITTLNNVEGSINFQSAISVPQATNIVNNNGIVTGNTFVTFNAQNGINVVPHINGDGSITMALRPVLASVQPAADGSIQQSFQQVQTTRIVQNGETMVLGGFITKQYTNAVNKVPILGDLPIIGNLFTQRNRVQTGAETLVFVTPTIIEDRSQGTVGTLGSGGQSSPTP